MAYSISGIIFDEYNNPVPNCCYQFLFLKVNPISDPTCWNDIRTTDNFGYYSADILDGSQLGSEGNFSVGDEILIKYWIQDSTGNIVVFADWIHIIEDTKKEFIVQNLKLYQPHPPIANFTNLPNEGLVNTLYLMINNSICDWFINELTPFNTIFYQHCTYRSVTIFDLCCIKSSNWDYDNGSEYFLGKHDGSRLWDNPGIYNVKLTTENFFGLQSIFTEQITIRYTVTVDFIFSPNPGILNQPIDFTNTSLDPSSVVTKYIWEMYDGDILSPPSDIYEGDYSLAPHYIFHSSPDRCVILKAEWNDGFIDIVSEITKCVPFLPIADFEKIDTTCAPIYRDRSVAGLSPKIYYWWEVSKRINPTTWKKVYTLEGDDAVEIQFHFPDVGSYKIYHKVEDSNVLTDDIEKFYDVTVCPCGTGVTGGGGVYRPLKKPEAPLIKVKFLDIDEKRKVKLKLKLVKTEQLDQKPIITILE